MSQEEISNVDRKSKQIAHLLHPPLNQKAAAEFLGLGSQTLANWRSKNCGPRYLKLSPGPRGRVAYLLEDLKDFLGKCKVDPEAR
jgi:hypothetical protein